MLANLCSKARRLYLDNENTLAACFVLHMQLHGIGRSTVQAFFVGAVTLCSIMPAQNHDLLASGVMMNCFVASQGIVGTMPWVALGFTTLYLQLLGFSDMTAAIMIALFSLGCALGSLFGGYIGTRPFCNALA